MEENSTFFYDSIKIEKNKEVLLPAILDVEDGVSIVKNSRILGRN